MSSANSESVNDGKAQNLLPDLYRLLGLAPLESDRKVIEGALLAMQKKVVAAQKTDLKLSQRAAKVVALGNKNLLQADRKLVYDRAWASAFGASEPVAVNTSLATPANEAVEARITELEWDLQELEAFLPSEDPRSPFDLGGFLRRSASLPESNPVADYDKLQSFLGGTTTATIEAPESISAARLIAEYSLPRHQESVEPNEGQDLFNVTKGPILAQRIPPGGMAKHIRRKRTRAMLLSIGGIVAVLAGVLAATFFLVRNQPEPRTANRQMAQSTPEKDKPNIPPLANAPTDPSPLPQSSGLPRVAGLDGPSSPPEPMGNTPAEIPTGVQPVVPISGIPAPENPTPGTLSPGTPAPGTPITMPGDAAPTMPATVAAVPMTTEPAPVPTPDPPADPVLSDADKSAWNKAMKELLKTLGAQNFQAAKEQLAGMEKSAKTQLQKQQFKRIETVARLTEEFHGFLVDAISSLDAAETFKYGGSSEAAFIDGNETAVALKIRGRTQSFKLTELQIGIVMGLVDLKMDTQHPLSLARKAAFSLVHPTTNSMVIKSARERMAQAAVAGAVEADMPLVFDEDYSLKQQP